MLTTSHCTAFAGSRRLASGALAEVAVAVRTALDAGETDAVLVFDDDSGAALDLDLRGDADAVRARYALLPAAPEAETTEPKRGPGRPRLGVVSREISLLPRHWDWLAAQPGGASAVLRKLVEQARRAGAGTDRKRRAREAAYRVMAAIAGDAPGFEEATRALFADDAGRFAKHMAAWPADVRRYVAERAADAFD
jgi:hypothetical protein